MYSLHGVMVCSVRGMLILQKCFSEGYYKDVISDKYTAIIQAFYNVYGLKKPLVYQRKDLGGWEEYTKVNIGKEMKINQDPNLIEKSLNYSN